MVKPLSEHLSDLSLHAKHVEDEIAAAKKETHDKVVARRERVRAAAAKTVENLQVEMKSAGDVVSSSFAALKGKVSADADALKSSVSSWKKELDATRAERRADRLEFEASAAIDYAISAVEQAKMAAVDAVIGRREALDARMP